MIQRSSKKRTSHSPYSRLVFALLLLNYAFICLGLPLPALISQPVDTANAAPFPCQGNGCGCRSAESCWKACCCNTSKQKLAWAKQNNVKPPEYVIAAAAKESPTVAKSCCANKKQLVQTTCVDVSPSNLVRPVKAKTPMVDWVFYVEAERCRGGSAAEWIVTPLSLPMNRSTLTWDSVHVVDFQITLSEKIPAGPAYPPPSPPPRTV